MRILSAVMDLKGPHLQPSRNDTLWMGTCDLNRPPEITGVGRALQTSLVPRVRRDVGSFLLG